MLNEHDLADWEISDQEIPLFKAERNSYQYWIDANKIFLFDHIDGLFSVCKTLNGNEFNLIATAMVRPAKKK